MLLCEEYEGYEPRGTEGVGMSLVYGQALLLDEANSACASELGGESKPQPSDSGVWGCGQGLWWVGFQPGGLLSLHVCLPPPRVIIEATSLF